MQSPDRKVTAGALAGALSSLIVWLLTAIGGIEVPPEQAVAITTVLVFGLQYFTPNAQETPDA